MRTWQQRRDRTIAFIRNAEVRAHADLRALVADLLQSKYSITRHTPDISRGMEQIRWWHRDRRGGQESRHYRRACIAIESRILEVPVGTAAATVNALDHRLLRGRLDDDLRAVFRKEDDDVRQALLELTILPDRFMATRPLLVEGARVSGSAVRRFYFDPSKGVYELGPPGAAGGGQLDLGLRRWGRAVHRPVQAFYVCGQPRTGIDNLGAIQGADVPAADNVVITEALTGCSFMYQINGLNMTVAHISPRQGAAVNALAPELRDPANGTAFHQGAAAGGGTRIFGRVQGTPAHSVFPSPHDLDYDASEPASKVLVVGVRIQGVWQVWAQKRTAETPPTIVDSWRVS